MTNDNKYNFFDDEEIEDENESNYPEDEELDADRDDYDEESDDDLDTDRVDYEEDIDDESDSGDESIFDDFFDGYENEEFTEQEEDEDGTSKLLKIATNNNQANADDVAEEDALEGAYDDDKLEEELDTVMNADEDIEAEADIEDAENTYARLILEQCQGVDEDNKPKATIAISLTLENPETEKQKVLAEAAFCSAPLEINGRHRFVEVVLTYKSPSAQEMKVLWAHLQKYGELVNKVDYMNAVEIPSFKMYIVPFSTLGTSFMSAVEPVSWTLCSSKPETLPDQLRILFDSDDVDFYETDEIDLEAVDAEAQRMLDQNAEAYYKAEELEREKSEQEARNNATLENLRKGGFLS